MTKHEVIQAYTDGEIGRRAFVRRLTALGVSSAAALAYAHSLMPRAVAANGFVMRGQDDDGGDDDGEDDDGEYGTAIQLESDAEALDSATKTDEAVQGLLDDALSKFSADDFESFNIGDINVFEELERLQEQMETHDEALLALLEQFGSTGTQAKARKAARRLQGDPGTPEEFLRTLSDTLDVQAGLYTALVPAIGDAELRQTMMSIAMVKARQAAFARTLTGRSAYPAPHEVALSPHEADARLDEIAER
jgi:hypothetical protein